MGRRAQFVQVSRTVPYTEGNISNSSLEPEMYLPVGIQPKYLVLLPEILMSNVHHY